MLVNKAALFVSAVVIQIFLSSAQKSEAKQIAISTLFPNRKYPASYRDHVYHKLSENGKEIFFAINIHPLCKEKKGVCIPRGRCIEKSMLYISRVCYHRDLVCCYDTSFIPTVAVRSGNVDNSTEDDIALDSSANNTDITVKSINITITGVDARVITEINHSEAEAT